MKNSLKCIVSLIITMCILTSSLLAVPASAYKVTMKIDETVTANQRNNYYKTSAFIGSSIGVGQQNYFRSKGNGYLGNPLFMVRGCYSFNNDFTNNRPYMICWRGTPYHAWDAIRYSGVDKVFINMGTNDMYTSAQDTYNSYVRYLQNIRRVNPNVVIFIEATPPMWNGSQRAVLNNRNIDRLNSLISNYCAQQKDMYYIDINSVLKDSSGGIAASYTSDRYVHLTNSGYARWMKAVTAYTDVLIVKERRVTKACDAVSRMIERRRYKSAKAYIELAEDALSKLDNSTKKDKLTARLNKLKLRYRKRTGETIQ